jgi:hypothetical protein
MMPNHLLFTQGRTLVSRSIGSAVGGGIRSSHLLFEVPGPAVRPVRESIERGSAGLLVLVVAAWEHEPAEAGNSEDPPGGGSLR